MIFLTVTDDNEAAELVPATGELRVLDLYHGVSPVLEAHMRTRHHYVDFHWGGVEGVGARRGPQRSLLEEKETTYRHNLYPYYN